MIIALKSLKYVTIVRKDFLRVNHIHHPLVYEVDVRDIPGVPVYRPGTPLMLLPEFRFFLIRFSIYAGDSRKENVDGIFFRIPARSSLAI